MDILAHARRRAFSLWLRTGRLPSWAKPREAEVKYNPWHDTDDGRFTFAGHGRYFGRGSARESVTRMHERVPDDDNGFNGGGASGSWEAPDNVARRRTQARTSPAQPSAERRSPQSVLDAYARQYRQALDNPRNWRRVEANGYVYRIDALGRTRHVSGTIVENPAQRRSRTVQARAGGLDRRGSDQGGHYIARRFNGPTEAFNHFAQDGSFNRRSYRRLEDQWAVATRAGKRVTVSIVPLYEGTSQRPSFVDVSFRIDGRLESLKFPNEPQGRPHAKR